MSVCQGKWFVAMVCFGTNSDAIIYRPCRQSQKLTCGSMVLKGNPFSGAGVPDRRVRSEIARATDMLFSHQSVSLMACHEQTNTVCDFQILSMRLGLIATGCNSERTRSLKSGYRTCRKIKVATELCSVLPRKCDPLRENARYAIAPTYHYVKNCVSTLQFNSHCIWQTRSSRQILLEC